MCELWLFTKLDSGKRELLVGEVRGGGWRGGMGSLVRGCIWRICSSARGPGSLTICAGPGRARVTGERTGTGPPRRRARVWVEAGRRSGQVELPRLHVVQKCGPLRGRYGDVPSLAILGVTDTGKARRAADLHTAGSVTRRLSLLPGAKLQLAVHDMIPFIISSAASLSRRALSWAGSAARFTLSYRTSYGLTVSGSFNTRSLVTQSSSTIVPSPGSA